MKRQTPIWTYKDGEKSEIPEWAKEYGAVITVPMSTRKIKIMNSKQQAASIKAQQKAQKEASDNEFRQRARMESLSRATYLATANKERVSEIVVIAAAEKIYQWLIKVLK